MSILVNKYLVYPAHISKIEGGLSIVIKNDGSSSMCGPIWKTVYSHTQGPLNIDDVLKVGAETIVSIAESFIEEKQIFPGSGNGDGATHFIYLQYHQALKIVLRNIMLSDGIRPIDICKELGLNQHGLNKILSLNTYTSIEDLSKIFSIAKRPINIIV